MKLFSALAVSGLVLSCASAACAAPGVTPTPGWYGEVYGGAGIAGDSSLSVSIPTYPSTGKVTGLVSGSQEFNPKIGGFGAAAVGYSFDYGLALEVEGVYAGNAINTNLLDAETGIDANASTKAYGGLVNGMWAVGRFGPVVPYVGAGVGYGGVHYTLYGSTVNDDGVMWQFKGGFAFPLGKKVSLDLGYRYLSSSRYSTSELVDISGVEYVEHLRLITRLHIVTGGLRVRF